MGWRPSDLCTLRLCGLPALLAESPMAQIVYKGNWEVRFRLEWGWIRCEVSRKVAVIVLCLRRPQHPVDIRV